MESLLALISDSRPFLPLAVALTAGSVLIASAELVLRARMRKQPRRETFSYAVVMLALTAVCFVWVVLALPVSDQLRGQLLSLLGLALTAVVAFSSTTFVANAMAGLMLRAVGNFRPGDFVRVEGNFGRVTERALFHTEIQTEDRDLSTLPNLYLVTHPVTVVRSSGTIVSTTLSIGYDVDQRRVDELLLAAAARAELADAFVQVRRLGDFSVEYRVAGFLADVNSLLTARSRLMRETLDSFHQAGVQIMSPTFMGQWRLEADQRILPAAAAAPAPATAEPEAVPEEIIFDKADQAASIEKLENERQRLVEQAKTLAAAKPRDDAAIARIERQVAEIAAQIEATRAREKPQ